MAAIKAKKLYLLGSSIAFAATGSAVVAPTPAVASAPPVTDVLSSPVLPYTSPNTCENDLSDTFRQCFQVVGTGLRVNQFNGSITNLTNYGGLTGDCVFYPPNQPQVYGPYYFNLGPGETFYFAKNFSPPVTFAAGQAAENCVTHFASDTIYQDIHA